MLKELNTIASNLLGLQGYPLQPVAWAEIFGRRRAGAAAGTAIAGAKTAARVRRTAAMPAVPTRRQACG